jgi:hypothetical protein
LSWIWRSGDAAGAEQSPLNVIFTQPGLSIVDLSAAAVTRL